MKKLTIVLLIVVVAVFAEEAIFVTVETATDESVIYKMGPDGSSPSIFFTFDSEPADSNRSYISHIDIAPSGRYLAITSDHDGYHNPARKNIFTINSEGTQWRQVTPAPNANEYWYSGPTGSVSGQVTWGGDYVAFATICCQGVIGEFSADAFGNFSIPNVPPGVHIVFAYTWGGVEMVYGYGIVDVTTGVDNDCDIMNVGYSEAYGKDECLNPTWSPDGNYIYYESSLSGSVYKTSVPGDWTDDSILVEDWGTSFYDFDVRHSDGKIVYGIDDDGLYLANSNGTGRTQIFSETSEVSLQYPCKPHWSPDNIHVAFLAFYYTPTSSGNIVCVLNTTSGEIENYFGWGDGYFPEVYGWSLDGTYVLVSVHGGDWSESELWKVNPVTPETDAHFVYGPASIIDAAWGDMSPSAIDETSPVRPSVVALFTYPNPFNSGVTISAPVGAEIEIFDVNGRLVQPLTESVEVRGGAYVNPPSTGSGGVYFEFTWRPDESLGSGVYLVRATIPGNKGLKPFVSTKRIVYLK